MTQPQSRPVPHRNGGKSVVRNPLLPTLSIQITLGGFDILVSVHSHKPIRYSPLAKGVRGLYSSTLLRKSSSNLNDIVIARAYMGSSVFADHQWQLLRQLWHNLRVRNGRYGSKQCSISKTSVHASSQPVLDPRNRQEIVSIGGTHTSRGPSVRLE